MQPIDYFAWFVLIVIIVVTVVLFVALAMLPGKMARKNNHPNAAAINMAGWLGLLLTAGTVWILAMVWANMKPVGDAALAKQNDEFRQRIDELEAQLSQQEAKS